MTSAENAAYAAFALEIWDEEPRRVVTLIRFAVFCSLLDWFASNCVNALHEVFRHHGQHPYLRAD